ncbi:unnamed protein product [Sphagnum compactum]
MELEASSVAVYDPGDPNLGEHQGSRSNDSGKQIPQELSLSEIMPFEASHESSGIPDQEFQQGGSRNLSTLDQLRAKKMPTDSPPPKRKSVYLLKPADRGMVTCDEVISILRNSQLDELYFELMDCEEDGFIEADREDRLHLFDAIGKCESLKSIKIERGQKLHVEEILLLRPTLEKRIERLVFHVDDCDQRVFTILCEMLAKNNVLKDVCFLEVEDEHLEVLCEILPTFYTFKPILDLNLSAVVTISGVTSLVSILGMNSIVRRLHIWDLENLLGSNGLEMILNPLIGHLGNPPVNHSVNDLGLGRYSEGFGGTIKAVVEMLRTNKSLTSFLISSNSTFKPVMILDPLTGHSGNPPLNQSLKQLIFWEINIGRDGGGIKAIAEMLRTNNSLTKFSIVDDRTLKPSDVCTILSSLENNQSLRELGFHGCDRVEGADLLGKMMDLLRVNPWLTEIDLRNTPLEREGQAAQVRAQLERNAQDYMKVVRGMPRVPPKFIKVFLCGNAYSGKTTLRRSMARSLEKGVKSHFIPLVEIIELRKPFKCCFNDPNEWDKRTRGINIKVLVDNLDMKVSIWDLAGQDEYHAFHDMMLPDLSTQGNVCYFLLVCNPFLWDQSGKPKTPQELEAEFSYWLRFISSNTKRSSNFAPRVTIALTNKDQEYIHKQFMDPCVTKLKARFVDFINLSSNTHSINAHCSREAKQVLKDVTTTCKNVLENLPQVYEICLQVQLGICQWIKEHPNQPIVNMQIFEREIFAKTAFQLQVLAPQLAQPELEKPQIAIAMFLHDAGEIIYFKNEDFVVLNLNWFCHKMMGHLIKLRGHVESTNLAKTFPNGFGEMEHLEILLGSSLKDTANLVGLKKDEILNYLVRLMVKMDFAYEVSTVGEFHSQSVTHLFVPTTLQFDQSVAKGERRLKWTSQFSSDAEVIYIGQRLQCGDQEHTTLTPGFFPRIQVALHNHFKVNWRYGQHVNERNLMKIWRDGLEVFVELSGDEMGGHVFIDVLVKSAKTKLKTLQLVNDHVLSQIEHLCSVAQGCQGVALVRGVLRPKVVKNLVLCKNRKNQTVLVEDLKQELVQELKQELVQDLKQELLVENFELSQCVHTWPEVDVPSSDRDYLSISMDDKVTSLLGELQTLEVLDRHFRHLKNVEMDVDNFHADNMSMENARDVFQNDNESLDVKPQGSFRQNSSKISNILERRDISNNEVVANVVAEMRAMENRIIDHQKLLENRIIRACEEIRVMGQTLYGKVTMKVDGIMNLILQLDQRQVPCNFYFTTPGTKRNRQLIMELLSGMEIVHLHLLCEHVDGIHVVERQKGVEIKLSPSITREKINRLIMASLTVLSLLVKVGAHVTAGIGNMIPNIGQFVALTCDTQSLNDYLPDSKGSNHQAIIKNLPTSSDAQMAMQGNGKKAAEQWLVNLLKGKEILDLFSLKRVKYVKIRDCNEGYPIRWVCEHHWKEGMERGTIEDCAFKPT